MMICNFGIFIYFVFILCVFVISCVSGFINNFLYEQKLSSWVNFLFLTLNFSPLFHDLLNFSYRSFFLLIFFWFRINVRFLKVIFIVFDFFTYIGICREAFLRRNNTYQF